MREKSLYDVLGLLPTASDDEVRAAYRAAMRRVHPDMGGSEPAFRLARAAYRVLGDPERRHQYDLQLAASLDAEAWQETPGGPATAGRPSAGSPSGGPRPDDPQAGGRYDGATSPGGPGGPGAAGAAGAGAGRPAGAGAGRRPPEPGGQSSPFGGRVPAPDARMRRNYFVAMGVCVTLFVVAALVVRLYSLPAALAMMAVAAVIPPFAAIAVNRSPRPSPPVDRRKRPGGGPGPGGGDPGGPGGDRW